MTNNKLDKLISTQEIKFNKHGIYNETDLINFIKSNNIYDLNLNHTQMKTIFKSLDLPNNLIYNNILKNKCEINDISFRSELVQSLIYPYNLIAEISPDFNLDCSHINLYEMIDSYVDRHKIIINLYYNKKLSVKKISKLLNLSEKKINQSILSVIKKLSTDSSIMKLEFNQNLSNIFLKDETVKILNDINIYSTIDLYNDFNSNTIEKINSKKILITVDLINDLLDNKFINKDILIKSLSRKDIFSIEIYGMLNNLEVTNKEKLVSDENDIELIELIYTEGYYNISSEEFEETDYINHKVVNAFMYLINKYGSETITSYIDNISKNKEIAEMQDAEKEYDDIYNDYIATVIDYKEKYFANEIAKFSRLDISTDFSRERKLQFLKQYGHYMKNDIRSLKNEMDRMKSEIRRM